MERNALFFEKLNVIRSVGADEEHLRFRVNRLHCPPNGNAGSDVADGAAAGEEDASHVIILEDSGSKAQVPGILDPEPFAHVPNAHPPNFFLVCLRARLASLVEYIEMFRRMPTAARSATSEEPP